MAITDFFALESLIIAKLQADVTALKLVSGWGDFFKKGFSTQINPAAYVIYGNYKTKGDEKNRQGKAQLITQKWVVALVVRNVTKSDSNEKVRVDAGPLLLEIFQSLNNASLSNDHGNLFFINAMAPTYAAGVGIFPLAFESQFVIRST